MLFRSGILLFDFKLVHVPGETHGPDGLSRRPAQPDDEPDPPDDYEDWIDKAYSLMHIINPNSVLLLLPHSTYPDPASNLPAHKAATYSPPPTSYTCDIHMSCLINETTDNPLDFTLPTINPKQVFILRTSEADAADRRLNLVVSVLQTAFCPEGMINSEWKRLIGYALHFFIHASNLWCKNGQANTRSLYLQTTVSSFLLKPMTR